MNKVIIRVLFICTTSISLNFLYHVFYTDVKYRRNPPYLIPDLELPIFFIITFVLAFIFEWYILKSKGIWAFSFALFVAIIFYLSATVIEKKYNYLYEHYYQNHPYETLTHLKEYSETRDNYITLGKALKDEGIKIKSIQGGYTEKGHLDSPPEAFQKKLYYINDDLYIIFDWNEEKITAKENQQSIRQAIAKQYGNFPVSSNLRFSHSEYKFSLQDEYGMTLKRYIIEPTKENTFKFIES